MALISTVQTATLSELWDFLFLGDGDLATLDPRNLPPTSQRVWVPSAFDALPGTAGRRGMAYYRTTIRIPAGHVGRLEFGAVSIASTIWIDDTKVKESTCGYEPLLVEVPVSDPSQEREHTLTVIVDNRFNFERAPMHEEYFDFYQYGGILREVRLETWPANAPILDYVHVLPTAGWANGEVELRIGFTGELAPTAELDVQFDGGEVRRVSFTLNGPEGCATLRVPAHRIWSPASPHLHRARVATPGGVGREVRFGLRHIAARDGALWLNGRRLQLRGYNRHEWHPSTGPSTTPAQMFVDLQLLRELGCNFVRGSHYAQDQRFLDLCDELGLLVWEENLGWGQRERTLASAKFRADHERSLRAMVRASANHPSVIIWGFLNEAGTDSAYARPAIEESVHTLRSLDPTRLVSYASMFACDDKHFDLVDLIAINLYAGWYSAEGVENPLDLIAPAWAEAFRSIDARGFAAKPIIVSESGVEALYGWRDAHGDFFTEQFQAEYLRRICTLAETNPRCSGLAIWHFADARTYGGGWSLKRPRTFNNKGTFDEYRRPKEAAAVVRSLFRAAEQREQAGH